MNSVAFFAIDSGLNESPACGAAASFFRKILVNFLTKRTCWSSCPLTSVGTSTVPTQSLSFIEAARHFAGDGDKQRVYFKAKSDYAVEPLNSQAIDALLAALKRNTEPVTVIFEAYGGAINRVASDATAFPHRAPLDIVSNTSRNGPRVRRPLAESKP
jgi:hypothetical protein